MDLRSEILKKHSRAQKDKIVDYVGNNPSRFKALVNVFLEGPYRVTQRAAWPLGYCVERQPHLVRPHLKAVLDHLKKPGIHDAVKRNTLRLLQFVDVPARHRGRVADVCFGFLQNKQEPVAIRVFAMTVLTNLTQHVPELKQELVLMIEDQLPYGSPAFTSRAHRVLKSLI